jgi:hypothetical protein
MKAVLRLGGPYCLARILIPGLGVRYYFCRRILLYKEEISGRSLCIRELAMMCTTLVSSTHAINHSDVGPRKNLESSVSSSRFYF